MNPLDFKEGDSSSKHIDWPYNRKHHGSILVGDAQIKIRDLLSRAKTKMDSNCK